MVCCATIRGGEGMKKRKTSQFLLRAKVEGRVGVGEQELSKGWGGGDGDSTDVVLKGVMTEPVFLLQLAPKID